jgi:hypothetical protein
MKLYFQKGDNDIDIILELMDKEIRIGEIKKTTNWPSRNLRIWGGSLIYGKLREWT